MQHGGATNSFRNRGIPCYAHHSSSNAFWLFVMSERSYPQSVLYIGGHLNPWGPGLLKETPLMSWCMLEAFWRWDFRKTQTCSFLYWEIPLGITGRLYTWSQTDKYSKVLSFTLHKTLPSLGGNSRQSASVSELASNTFPRKIIGSSREPGKQEAESHLKEICQLHESLSPNPKSWTLGF